MKRLAWSRAGFLRVLAAIALIASGIAFGPDVGAVDDEEFELDGNVEVDSEIDWETLFDSTPTNSTNPGLPNANFIDSGFAADFGSTANPGSDTSGYATGTKDTLPISHNHVNGWQCKTNNNIGEKFNLINAYTAAYRPPSGPDAGDLMIYFASEIMSPNGDRNAGFWFLQDDNVGCQSPGGNLNWNGSHIDGDIFVVAAFTGGGDTEHISVYEWVDDTPTNGLDDGHLNVDTPLFDEDVAPCDSPTLPSPHEACAIVNSDPTNAEWPQPDSNAADALQADQFFEGAVNLDEIMDNPPCITKYVANSRSAQSPGSTLHDFAVGDLDTCGSLTVRKFIDVNQDGGDPDTTGCGGSGQAPCDITTAPSSGSNPLDGWKFEVYGPDPTPADVNDTNGPKVCDGTTNSSGQVVCLSGQSLANLSFGTYTVIELAQSAQTSNPGFFNTAPGPAPGTTAVVAATQRRVLVDGDRTTFFGNSCFVDVTLTVNLIPTGTTGFFIHYKATAGVGPTTQQNVAVTPSGGTGSTTINDTFAIGSTIAWGHGTGLGTGSQAQVAGPSFTIGQADGYPTCSVTKSDDFDTSTVSGLKYKDINGDGVRDANGVDDQTDPAGDTTPDDETPLGGFVIELWRDNNNDDLLDVGDTFLQATVSGSNGTYEFTGVAPGEYVIHERTNAEGPRDIDETSSTDNRTTPAGWLQTGPANGADRAITVALGGAAVGDQDFGNTPLSNITVTFDPLTNPARTEATIVCSDQNANTPATIGSSSTDSAGTTTHTINNVQVNQSKVTCEITITDP